VQGFFERLFGKKNEGSALGTEAESSSAIETPAEQTTESAEPDEVKGLLDQTMIVSSPDLSDQIDAASKNVFEDTLPGKVALDDTAVSLPDKEIPPTASREIGLSAAQRCHIGNVRNRNEDSSFIFTAEFGGQEPFKPTGLYIVADGMGGHHAGHEASKNVARLVAQHVLERVYVPLLRNSTSSHSPPPEPIGEVMVDAVQTANLYVHDNDPKKNSGTTLTAALILGRRLYVAHVGDSRAYLYAGDKLQLLTTDHSYVRRLQDAGQLTEEEAAVHPQRNMLYKAVGQGGDLDIDTFTKSLPQEGKLILCSDGLWGLVAEATIAEVLSREISLPTMTDELIVLAREAGGYDNITAVVVDFNFA